MPKRRNEEDMQTGATTDAIIQPMVIKRLMTDAEIMELLSISRTTLFRLMNHPVSPMPHIKFFAALRFDVNDVGEWLQEWKRISMQPDEGEKE